MGNVLKGVERQIRLAGHNRMAMLLFSVQAGGARCGLNVFKVGDALRCPAITPPQGQNAQVAGSDEYRDQTSPGIDQAIVLDLAITAAHQSDLQALQLAYYAVL